MEDKIKHLLDYCLGMVHKEDGKTLYMKYLNEIQSITPQELVFVVDFFLCPRIAH